MQHFTVRVISLVGVGALGLAAAGTAAAQAPELIVEIEKQEIYEGESVLYRVTLNHAQNPNPPVLEGLDAFQVTSLGEQSLDSRQITIINGRRSEIVRRGRQYNYRLTPLRSGTLRIPAPKAEADGESLVGEELVLRVRPPDDQDSVLLNVSADRTSVYPMQPFELTLTIAVKDLPGDLADRDPLSVQPEPPALQVVWLDDAQLPDGLEPEKSWREILEPLVSRGGNGFQVNNIGSSSAFSLFRRNATGFHPNPERTTRAGDDGEEAGYWEYKFSRRLLPRRIGTYQFAPVTLKGTFADAVQNGQLVGRRIFALARGVDVVVKDVPLDGRPDDYIGAVGRFEVDAELAPTSVRVGDPMTLTLTLSGQGTLDDARPPAIADLPGVAGAFRTYDATEESQPGARRFTYSVRPLRTDVAQFPPVPVSYFDVEAEEYVTRSTDPIAVTVREAETLSESEIVTSPARSASMSQSLEASEGGVFANDADLSSFRNEAVHPGRWLGAWIVMIAGWSVASLSIDRVRRFREDPARIRRRSATSRARAAIEAAAARSACDDAAATCESLRRAVTGLIADYANVPEAGLTPRDAEGLLESLGIDDSLRREAFDWLNACDAARFGAATDEVVRLQQDAEGLVERLIEQLKSPSERSTSSTSAVATLFLFVLTIGGCSTAPDLETSRQFQEAEQTFDQATSPEEFVVAAQRFGRLNRDGFASGAALYNQGNAWMRAGRPGRAIAAYRLAQRYRPRDPYLTANLQSALVAAGRTQQNEERPGIARYVFFWQDWLSYPEKFRSTTLLLAATLGLLLLSQLTSHRILLRRSAFVVGGACLLAAASTAWDWHRFERVVHGVVTDESVTARKGNSESYESAFSDPLSEGVEFVVLDVRTEWLHVQVGDAGTGWIPRESVETF